MKARIRKWGHSLALRIPKSFAVQARLEQDALVEVSLIDGRLLVEPITKSTPSLDQLLAGVTEQNLHREVATGPSVGNEAW